MTLKNPPSKDPVIELLEQLDPVEGMQTIFEGTQELEIDPNIPTIIVVIGISASGKTSIAENLHENTERVRTATTRARRFKANPGKEHLTGYLNSITDMSYYIKILDFYHKKGYIEAEPSDAYTWLPWLPEDVTEEDLLAIINDYNLLESDFHYGNLYGLPKANLDEVIESKKFPVIITEISGYKSLEALLSEKYNLLLVNILPDDIETVKKSIQERSATTTKDQVAQRLSEEEGFLEIAYGLAHFHILNSREPGHSIKETQAELIQLLQSLNLL